MSVAQNVVLIVHYFPPINSSGAKRMEAMSKYLARWGRNVTVITTTKVPQDGDFTEALAPGVQLIELDKLGFARKSNAPADAGSRYRQTSRAQWMRKFKDAVLAITGQAVDPRLPFAFSFAYPWLAKEARDALRRADVVVGTCPPYPPLLAALIARKRFKTPAILDYRDQLSNCHEMPGTRFAKWLEYRLDRAMTKRADHVVTISAAMADYYRSMTDRVSCVMNGYDGELIEWAKAEMKEPVGRSQGPITVRYMGIITAGRIPHTVLAALIDLRRSGRISPADVRFEFYGNCDLLQAVLAERYLEAADFCQFLPAVSYRESLRLLVSADHLLFCENAIPPRPGEEKSAAGILTTKMFEYVASGRPVLADIEPDALAGSFIVQASSAHFVSRSVEATKAHLISEEFWNPRPVEVGEFVDSLSREAQARKFMALLDRVCAEHTGGGTREAFAVA